MRIDLYTKVILTIIALSLATSACKSLIHLTCPRVSYQS